MKPTKVCCFCERWESGGIESFLFNVLTRIDLTGLQIDLVTASFGRSVFTELLQKLGIQFFELSGRQRSVAENHRCFRSLLKERGWDVVHLNIFHGLSLSYLYIAQQEGVPVRIAHSHNTALRKSLTRPVKMTVHTWAKERFTQFATDLWACSKGAAEFLFSGKVLLQKGFLFIPNGIDTHRFQFDSAIRKSVRIELGLDAQFVVGNIGRLCDQKNQDFLLDIFLEILRREPKSCLMLVGDGDARPLLLQKARKLGIVEKVVFCGVTPRVEQLLWAMDVFVLPSRFEGLPVTAVEAQTAGLPCFFSDTVTKECRILDSTQFLPLTGLPQEWASMILTANAVGDRSASALDTKNAGFDISHTVQQVEAGYRRLSAP